ncbi:MAG: cupredoxin domain-containing protein [Actinomycetota bacterium]
MSDDKRDRFLMPILLPFGALALIAVLAIGFAFVLLSLSATAATGTALAVAASIMVVAGALSSRGRVGIPQLFSLITAIGGVALFAGGVALATGAGHEEEGGEAEKRAAVAIAAKDLQFDPREVSVPSGEPLAIAFDNQDAGTQHNIKIFEGENEEAPVLFTGELITGPAKVTYNVEPLEDGSYLFICDVHPTTMTGTMSAGEEKPAEPSSTPTGKKEEKPEESPTASPAAAAKTIELKAPQNAIVNGFDPTTLSAPADTPTTIHFVNEESGVPHNVEVFEGTDASGKQVFAPPGNATITGPAETDYKLPPLTAGDYFYHCFVHPSTMTGTLKVA